MADSRKTGLAIVSLILGILSLFVLGFLTAIPGIITGHMARSRAKNDPANYGGSGIALAGLILSYLALIASIAMIGFVMTNPDFMDSLMQMQQEATEMAAPAQ